jgi:hypothetical protein
MLIGWAGPDTTLVGFLDSPLDQLRCTLDRRPIRPVCERRLECIVLFVDQFLEPDLSLPMCSS